MMILEISVVVSIPLQTIFHLSPLYVSCLAVLIQVEELVILPILFANILLKAPCFSFTFRSYLLLEELVSFLLGIPPSQLLSDIEKIIKCVLKMSYNRGKFRHMIPQFDDRFNFVETTLRGQIGT